VGIIAYSGLGQATCACACMCASVGLILC